MRGFVLCAALALAGCGAGGSGPGVPNFALIVSWISTQGAAGGAGTQADAIHLAHPPLAVTVTAWRAGVAQAFWLDAGTCSAVSITPGPPPATAGAGRTANDSAPPAALYAWEIASASMGMCTITVHVSDGSTATLHVFSEM